MSKTTTAIIGASGYSGQELVRLLVRHPQIDIAQFTSRQYAGQQVADVFPRVRGEVEAVFIEPDIERIDAEVVFLALPHGVAAEYASALLGRGITVIDLSADFRLRSPADYRGFYGQEHPAPELLEQAVYGLPELYRDRIKQARLVACPGCYPTSIILGITPLLEAGLVQTEGITVCSLSGVSGAGRKVAEEYLYPECNESLRAYGLPRHRHLGEIEQELSLLAGQPVTISFVPHLVPVNRGILSTIHLPAAAAAAEADLVGICRQRYAAEPFVRVTDELPDTKNVTLTNYCDLSVRYDRRTDRVVVVSAEDNLTKGAAGQAVQCLNLLRGYAETTGLR